MPLERKVCDVTAALGRVGGNGILLREMLHLFCQDAPEFQQRLRSAIAVSDGAAIQKATHGLRGMLAYFSAELALEIAERIEQMALPTNQARAQAAALELDAEIERLVRAVESELPS
jgi:HPt (histidine-containing phosphotransfer) domain-containing protein